MSFDSKFYAESNFDAINLLITTGFNIFLNLNLYPLKYNFLWFILSRFKKDKVKS